MDTPPPLPTVLYQLATGRYVSHAIYVAGKLGIADLLGPGAQRHDDSRRPLACTRPPSGACFGELIWLRKKKS